MPRPKRRPHRFIPIARSHIEEQVPALKNAPLRFTQLDGPPGAPRYAAFAAKCTTNDCPYGVPPTISEAGRCPICDCRFRCSARVLMNRDGDIIQTMESTIRWG
ncbi:MAG: hypothetical protein AAGF95_09055 [Chloroflexota bacterium]